jgi:hypothetical protein
LSATESIGAEISTIDETLRERLATNGATQPPWLATTKPIRFASTSGRDFKNAMPASASAAKSSIGRRS